jgi:hypothetical protein
VAEGRGEVPKRLSNISFAKQEEIPYYKDSAGSRVVPPLKSYIAVCDVLVNNAWENEKTLDI